MGKSSGSAGSLDHLLDPSHAAPELLTDCFHTILLDRGWGKPPQMHAGEDEDIRITLRQITEGRQ
jgi:hypothetical protein